MVRTLLSIVTHLFLNCGAAINEVNSMRKHLSRIKGGNTAPLGDLLITGPTNTTVMDVRIILIDTDLRDPWSPVTHE